MTVIHRMFFAAWSRLDAMTVFSPGIDSRVCIVLSRKGSVGSAREAPMQAQRRSAVWRIDLPIARVGGGLGRM